MTGVLGRRIGLGFALNACEAEDFKHTCSILLPKSLQSSAVHPFMPPGSSASATSAIVAIFENQIFS